MIALKPKLNDFLFKATNLVDVEDALVHVLKDYVQLKVNDLERKNVELKNKYKMDYEKFIEYYKKNHTQAVEEDFYAWDEVHSLLVFYKEISNQWI